MSRLLRVAHLAIHLLYGVCVAGLVFPFLDELQRNLRIQRWSARLLAILRIQLHVAGAPPADGPALIVANHISWLDIFVINAACPARFVAKREVRAWPVVGWLCARVGTLFIDRGLRHETGRINQAMQTALERGEKVAVFPEGTTSVEVGRFHASLLHAAPATGAPVWPVALRYRTPSGERADAVDYIGETCFMDSLTIIAGQPAIHAELLFALPVESAGRTRRELAHRVRHEIVAMLGGEARAEEPVAVGIL